MGVGDPDAPVKVEVFEDFLCPYCGQFEATSRDDLRQAAADGTAYVVYRPIAFLSEYSTRSLNAFAVVLAKSGGDVALKFHDRLFENQPEEGGAMPDDEWLIDQAVEAGADEAAIRPGIENLSFEQWMVNGNEDASKRGVNSTPTVFVNGETVSGSSIEDLAAQVQGPHRQRLLNPAREAQARRSTAGKNRAPQSHTLRGQHHSQGPRGLGSGDDTLALPG